MTNFMMMDDAVYEQNESLPFEIRSSRVYLHYKNFIGDQNELDMNERLEWLAYTKYGFSRDELVFYSIIDVHFEQMAELTTQYALLVIIGIEAVLLIAFLVVFDLKTIFLLSLATISFALAILSTMTLLAIKLNFVILMHFAMLPAFLAEFFIFTPYLYLYPAVAKTKRPNRPKFTVDDNFEHESSPETNKLKKRNPRRLKQLKFSYSNFIQHSVYFLLIIALPSFVFSNFVSTYAFTMLYKFLIVLMFNLILHLLVVFPLLLLMFGSVWI